MDMYYISIVKSMYVYLLHCSDDSFYVGVTNNLEQRVKQHEQGINRDAYTYTRRPVELVWYEIFSEPTTAIAIEKQIKGWSHAKKQALIDDDFNLLQELSRNARKRYGAG